MRTHYDYSDLQFEEKFETGSFDPELFNHEAHLRLAWIHIKKYGQAKASENIPHQIVQFVTSLGAQNKYKEELTLISINIISSYISKAKSTTFKNFILEFPELTQDFKSLLAQNSRHKH